MTGPEPPLAAARRILAAARRDRDRRLHLSARVSAHRAAVVATQAWLESRGQIAVSTSVLENVALDPGLDAEVRAAATALDRHRLEDGLPGPPPSTGEDPVAETAAAVDAGARVVRFVEERMDAELGSTRSGGDP